MSNEHPRYPHPTITEAVCDIRFQLPDFTDYTANSIEDGQSTSITLDGALWRRGLVQVVRDDTRGESFSIAKEADKDIEKEQKRRDLIQLLNSWLEEEDEEDEQEQQD